MKSQKANKTTEVGLIKVEGKTPAEIYTGGAVDNFLIEIKQKIDDFEVDISTKKGRADLKSFAYKITRSKTILDDMGKDLVGGWKEKAKVVDLQRKSMRNTLDAWNEELKKPLLEWEQAEQLRLGAIGRQINALKEAGRFSEEATVQEIEIMIVELKSAYDFDFQEKQAEATEAYDSSLNSLGRCMRIAKHIQESKARLEAERIKQEEAQKKYNAIALQKEKEFEERLEEQRKKAALEKARAKQELLNKEKELEQRDKELRGLKEAERLRQVISEKKEVESTPLVVAIDDTETKVEAVKPVVEKSTSPTTSVTNKVSDKGRYEVFFSMKFEHNIFVEASDKEQAKVKAQEVIQGMEGEVNIVVDFFSEPEILRVDDAYGYEDRHWQELIDDQ